MSSEGNIYKRLRTPINVSVIADCILWFGGVTFIEAMIRRFPHNFPVRMGLELWRVLANQHVEQCFKGRRNT
jgi:hypothetical protein